MSKRFCMVSVCEREISTQFFETYAEARNEMLKDVREHLWEFYHIVVLWCYGIMVLARKEVYIF